MHLKKGLLSASKERHPLLSGVPAVRPGEGEGRVTMLYTVAVILVVLWLLGLVSSYTMGGFIHILLVIAIIVVLLNVIQGRKVL